MGDSKLLDRIKDFKAVMDVQILADAQQARREVDIAADQKLSADIHTIFATLAPGDRNRVTREKFEQLGPTCGAEVTPREMTRALRFLDPTNLGFITEDRFTSWMRLPTNRVTKKLLVHLTLDPEDSEVEDDNGEHGAKGKKSSKAGPKVEANANEAGAKAEAKANKKKGAPWEEGLDEDGPGRLGQLSALSVFLIESILYGTFV